MLGHVDELNAVRRVAQERRPVRHRGQHAGLPLDAQFVRQPTARRYQPHDCLGLMDVELVCDEHPARRRIGVNRLGDMGREIFLGAGRPQGRGDHLARGDVDIGDQAQGAVTDVRELPSFDLAGLHRLGGGGPFQGLNGRQRITTHNMTPQLMQQWRVGIQGTDRFDRSGKRDWVSRFGLGVEPIAAPMRLKLGLAPKNAPRWRVKCGSLSLDVRLRRLIHAGSKHRPGARPRAERYRRD